MPLYLVRHAPVALEGICYGQIDVPTAMTADEAVIIVRERLEVSVGPLTVWTSPLLRCHELAQAYSNHVHPDVRLMEASFGVWEGLSWDDIHERYPVEMAEWGENWVHHPPPGGESAHMVQVRVERFIASLGSGVHLAFSHAGVVRAARVALDGQTWEDAMSEPVPYLGVERFSIPADA